MAEPVPPTRRALIAAGFADLERAANLLESRELADFDRAQLLKAFQFSANPDQALLLLIRLLARKPEMFDWLKAAELADVEPMMRLLGASEALGEFVIRHPEHIELFQRRYGAEPDLAEPGHYRKFLLASVGARHHDAQARDWISVAEETASETLSFEPESYAPEAGLLPYTETVAAPTDQELQAAELSEEADGPGIVSRASQREPHPVASLTGKEAQQAMRVAYRSKLLEIALADLCGADPVAHEPLIATALADLAGAALDAGLAVARAEAAEKFDPEDVADLHFAVIAMGKTGARELNYVSDVDVIFVHSHPDALGEQTAGEIATFLAHHLSKAISSSGVEPGLWEVDANLRPEGKDGAISRTVESHHEYYKRWASLWEFQALLKARPAAGDSGLGRRYFRTIWPLVWQTASKEGFVQSVQAMRKRVEENIPRKEEERELKLGPGGLRDVEFTVQLLQLVHGQSEESLRVRNTLTAIDRLCAAGYIGRSQAAELSEAYRYLRLLEHRIQLVKMRRTHLMPVEDAELRVLARSAQPPGINFRPTHTQLVETWQRTKRRVRALHEAIFYRPLLSTTAPLSPEDVQLSPQAVEQRLAALGYLDPVGSVRHIAALTQGLSRKAALQRQLLPAMLGWFADEIDPDGGLLAFRRLSERLHGSPWFLRTLRDSNVAAQRLCKVLASSRFIANQLEFLPESVKWFGNSADLKPKTAEELRTESLSKLAQHPQSNTAMRLLRLIRQREVLRTAIADATGLLTQREVSNSLSTIDQVLTQGALRVAERELTEKEQGRGTPAALLTDFLIVAMGRQGGREITYGSDLDVMFVQRPHPEADPAAAAKQATALASRIIALVRRPVKPAVLGEIPLSIDADLRPEGKQGPMVRTVDSYREYYHRWAEVWERQALLRARPVAGDDEVAAEFLQIIDPLRYEKGLTESEATQIRRIKARVEGERLPRGADPTRHLKLGRGGLSDVEWLVQLFQLQHAPHVPELRTTETVAALNALAEHALLPEEDAQILKEAWLLATRIRSGQVIWSGKASDVLPTNRDDLEAMSRWCGYPENHVGEFEEDYLRITRLARGVFETHFYGIE